MVLLRLRSLDFLLVGFFRAELMMISVYHKAASTHALSHLVKECVNYVAVEKLSRVADA